MCNSDGTLKKVNSLLNTTGWQNYSLECPYKRWLQQYWAGTETVLINEDDLSTDLGWQRKPHVLRHLMLSLGTVRGTLRVQLEITCIGFAVSLMDVVTMLRSLKLKQH